MCPLLNAGPKEIADALVALDDKRTELLVSMLTHMTVAKDPMAMQMVMGQVFSIEQQMDHLVSHCPTA